MKKQIVIEINEESHKAFRIYCIRNDTNMTEVLNKYIETLLKGKKSQIEYFNLGEINENQFNTYKIN